MLPHGLEGPLEGTAELNLDMSGGCPVLGVLWYLLHVAKAST